MTTPLVVVVGPTASGKSSLALRIAAACDGEIINADSVQVYQHFNVGSGKPSAAERAAIPHHLLDFRAPLEPLEASEFARLADAAIADIRARGKQPIVCGGTFLWVRALLFGLVPAPAADEATRNAHRALVERSGAVALHERLISIDPASAARLHPNDVIRVSRALEVYELSGQRLSELQDAHGFRTARYRARLVGVSLDPEDYETELRKRTRALFAAGFIDEVRQLLARGYGATRAMDSVGYRQIKEALERGPIDAASLEQEVWRTTRVFARRQRTWLREQDVQWLPKCNRSELDSTVLAELHAHFTLERDDPIATPAPPS